LTRIGTRAFDFDVLTQRTLTPLLFQAAAAAATSFL
jgi:hypothetical protein